MLRDIQVVSVSTYNNHIIGCDRYPVISSEVRCFGYVFWGSEYLLFMSLEFFGCSLRGWKLYTISNHKKKTRNGSCDHLSSPISGLFFAEGINA